MTHIIATDVDDCLREDGTPYPFALIRNEGVAFAETAGDIMGLLIDGYADLPDTEDGADQALVARWRQAVSTAAMVQAELCANAVENDTFDPATSGEDTLTALFGEKDEAVTGIDHWPHDRVPLVLVATDYAPFVTDRTPPGGNVLWIDPSDELAYLRSLANLGLIGFYTHDD